MLHTINDQPFYKFEDQLDFDLLHQEAADLLIYARDKFDFGTPSGAVTRGSDGINQLDDVNKELTARDQERMKGMTAGQRAAYLKIVKQTYFPWFVYPLNERRDWNLRGQKRDSWLPHVEKYMPNFIKAVESLKMFKHVGWARLYANEAFNGVQVHFDGHLNPANKKLSFDNFVFFNLNAKPLFLYDKDQHKKIYMKEKLFYFDAANYHGTDAQPFFNYSIRIDGEFTDDFSKSLKLSRNEITKHTLKQLPADRAA